MFGFLRLLLAIAVALSHVGVRVAGLNPGVVAVVGFYLISGYVMAGLISRHFNQPRQAGAFYLDRAIRLLPQYLTYLLLTVAWYATGFTATPFLSHAPSASDYMNNLLVVPLNYYMFNHSDQFTLIPPAWSLGAEIQFYLLAPLLLLVPRVRWFTGVLSLCVYIAALAALIHTEWFGYRLLPGILLFFLLGAYLHQRHSQGASTRAVALGVASTCLLVIGLLQWHGTLHQPFSLETLVGLAIGLLLLHTLAQRTSTWWDTLAGDISYGVFLNHFLVLWVCYPAPLSTDQLPGFLGISIGLAWLTQRLVEQPLLKLRHRIRSAHPTPRGRAA